MKHNPKINCVEITSFVPGNTFMTHTVKNIALPFTAKVCPRNNSEQRIQLHKCRPYE